MSSSSEDAPFRRIAIVGLGLIGGSIALSVRERWPSTRVAGVDSQFILAHALGSGAIDRGATRLAEIGEADLVILAAPVGQNVRLLPEAAREVGGEPLITDVGGTKRDIVRAAVSIGKSATFIGGHPIGGAERGGFGFARPDMFKGRPWIFTPDDATPDDVVQRLFGFVRGLGARPSRLDAASHDRVMAFLSHLPQLTASALMGIVGSAAGRDGLRLAGRGLVDTTRLASSPGSVWRDICSANADEIGHALDLLLERLTEIRSDLTRGEAIDAVFDEAGHWRADLMKGRE